MKSFLRILSLILIQFVLVTAAQAEVLFEGYYKVTQFKKHIGFFILKNEVDAKNKTFTTTSYLKLAKNGFNMTESLTAVSNTNFEPIEYSYLAVDDKRTKTIDVKVKNGKITGLITENGEKKKINKPLPKGTFFSSSLYYMILKSKDGLKTGVNFEFSAIAEELGEISKGSAAIDKKLVSRGALQLLRVNNTFAGMEYENLITDQGQNITANTPATGIETELVRHSEEAVQGIKIPAGNLEKVFGGVPAGKTNVLNN